MFWVQKNNIFHFFLRFKSPSVYCGRPKEPSWLRYKKNNIEFEVIFYPINSKSLTGVTL